MLCAVSIDHVPIPASLESLCFGDGIGSGVPCTDASMITAARGSTAVSVHEESNTRSPRLEPRGRAARRPGVYLSFSPPAHHLSDVLHTSPQVMNELLHGILARCITSQHGNQALSTLSLQWWIACVLIFQLPALLSAVLRLEP